ncbi:MAG: DUF427 domain-containing protein [Hyphomicrobiaceae bacterium]
MDGTRRITIERFPDTVTVTLGQHELARSQSAVVLREEGHDPVFYLPPEDIARDAYAPSSHKTHCPYKGDATYLSWAGPGGPVENIAWFYQDPLDQVAEIAGRIAFYPTKCEIRPSLSDDSSQN